MDENIPKNWYQKLERKRKLSYKAFPNCSSMKHGVQRPSILGFFRFFVYVNDVLEIVNGKYKPLLFADSTICT